MTFDTYTLGELVSIKYGKNQKKVLSDTGTVPIYGTGGLMGYATEALYDKPSVLIGRKGTIEKIRYVDHPFWTVDTLFYTIVNDSIVVPQFLYYTMLQLDLLQYNEGTTIPSLRTETLNRIELHIPSIDNQKKILRYLATIDNKIALNTAINENLEQQAQALFKNLIADIQERVPFTSVIQVLGGGTPKTGKQEYWNGKIPFFTPKDVGAPYVLTTEKSITPLGLDNCNSRLYPVNTVFLTARGTVGKVSLAGVPMSMNQSCYALAGKDGLHQIIVYHYVLETVKALKHKASGAVFDAIITRDFDTESVPALSSEQIDSFIAVAEPIYSDILNRTIENQRLAALRDTLLPKLMSGEIDVSAVKI